MTNLKFVLVGIMQLKSQCINKKLLKFKRIKNLSQTKIFLNFYENVFLDDVILYI